MESSSAVPCVLFLGSYVMGRGQHWRALRFGQKGRKHCQCCQSPQGHCGCPHSSTAHGLERCTPAAPALLPRCSPCSSEGDRRGVSGQGKGGQVVTWRAGPLAGGQATWAALCELSWQLCHLPALGRGAQHSGEMDPCMETPWSSGFAKGGAASFSTTSERCPGAPASHEGFHEGMYLSVGVLVWRNNSLVPVPFQH